MKKIIVIPARLSSSRLPNKVLLDLKGKTILQRVYEQCMKVNGVVVFIATDSLKVKKSCLEYTQNVIMTSVEHKSGTDRIAEAIKGLDFEAVINVQGDEPLFNPIDIKKLITQVQQTNNKYEVFSGYCSIQNNEQFFSLDVPKVVFNHEEELLYMSRSGIPGNKRGDFVGGFRQVCAYAFSKKSLMKFCKFNRKTSLEEIEDIEILRFIEIGIKIKMIEMSQDSISVDREEDLLKVLKRLKNVK